MKYLRLFANHTLYDQEFSSLTLPNVSYCEEDEHLHYNRFVEPATVLYGSSHYEYYPFIDNEEYYVYDGTEEIDGLTYYKWTKQGDEEGYTLLTTTRNYSGYMFDNPIVIDTFMIDDEVSDYKTFTLLYAGSETPDKVISVEHHNTQSLNANNKEYVDLSLPSGALWATCNVGASRPEEYGDYFAWGETSEKTQYEWSTYKYVSNENNLNKYCTFSEYGEVDNKKILDMSDDAARVNMGGDWHMPSNELLCELFIYTENEWVNNYNGSGVAGRVFRGTNGNELFIPAAGVKVGSVLSGTSSYCYLWSSFVYSLAPYYAYRLGFNSGYIDMYHSVRYHGLSVRGVLY